MNFFTEGLNRLKKYSTKVTFRARVSLVTWGSFIFLESVIVGFIKGEFGNLSNYVLHYAINISFFYLHAGLLKRIIRPGLPVPFFLPLCILSELMIYVSLVYGFDSFLLRYTGVFINKTPPPFIVNLLSLLWRGLYFMFFSTGYYFLMNYLAERKAKERLEVQRLHDLIEKEQIGKALAVSENAFLMARVNPHLMFNILELLYQKIRKISLPEAELIRCLSEVMRYAAGTEQNGKYAALGAEIDQVENLIRLHRFNQECCAINFAAGSDTATVKIIPLVLITVLENIFKHGDLCRQEDPAVLDIYVHSGSLIIQSRNLIAAHSQKKGNSSGLSNISRRLRFAYGTRAVMHYGIEKKKYFRLRIDINDIYRD